MTNDIGCCSQTFSYTKKKIAFQSKTDHQRARVFSYAPMTLTLTLTPRPWCLT